MWRVPAIAEPSQEPVSLAQAKAQLRYTSSREDEHIGLLIASARDYVEKYCNLHIAAREIDLKCDAFAEFSELPVAPVKSVSSISYVDASGTTQTLATDAYELAGDQFYQSIERTDSGEWPQVQPGSRVTVKLVLGYEKIPPQMLQAMLLLVGAWFENREETTIASGTISSLPESVSVNSLLCNYRRGL